MTDADEPRWLASLFLTLALLQLIPIWTVHHLPTCDGPAHLYNSWILRELLSGNSGPIAQHYAIDWRPHPNWSGHAVLSLLMTIVSPVAAEKVFVSAIVLLFLGSVWIYAGGRSFAFLAFPFAFHRFLHLGSYNFSLSLGLYLLIVAVWWRRRDRPNIKTIAAVAALLLLCYFSHPLAAVLAMASIAVLWVLTLRTRPVALHVRHLLAFIPLVPLLIWFLMQRGIGGDPHSGALFKRLRDLVCMKAIISFDSAFQILLGIGIFVVLVFLIVWTALRERRREADAFLAVTAMMTAFYFGAPEVFAGGDIPLRMSFFVYLVPIAWLSPRLPRWSSVAMVLALSVIALCNTAFLLNRYRHVDRQLTELIRSLDPVAPRTTLLPLLFRKEPQGMDVAALWHTVDYAAIEKELIDLDNFEPSSGYFPIKSRSAAEGINLNTIEQTPGEIDVAALSTRPDYIFTWEMPSGAPLERRLLGSYKLVSKSTQGRLYSTAGGVRFVQCSASTNPCDTMTLQRWSSLKGLLR